MSEWAAAFCAVVVTYHPDEAVPDNLRAMVRECGRAVVVDNGSSEGARARLAAVSGVTVLALGANQGVAAALNRGFEWATANGCDWVVTFDQDSRPHVGFGAALWLTHEKLSDAAVVGSHISEAALGGDYRWLRPHPRWPWVFQRVRCGGEDLPDVTMVVTSGALVSVETWRKLGGFDEKLFIDFVDTDFCLRVRAAGRSVAVSAGAILVHHLGRRERRVFLGLPFHPTHHSALRHYYIARNRWPMLRRHARRHPHWAVFEFVASALWFFRMLAFEHQCRVKLKAMGLGTWDGLRGCSGPCPEDRLLALQS
jgi:rhamnosyltransferase